MVKDHRTVIGSYDTLDKVKTVLHDLKNQGYPNEDITLYANENMINELRFSPNVHAKTNEVNETMMESNRERKEQDSFFNQIKDLLTPESNDIPFLSEKEGPQKRDMLAAYRENIVNGHIVIVVNDYKGKIEGR